MRTADDTALTFDTVESITIEPDTIVKLERVPADLPADDDAYRVIYTTGGTSEQRIAWVSYITYCMLRDIEKHKLAVINREADALE